MYKELSRVYNGTKTMVSIECECGMEKSIDAYSFKLRGFKCKKCKKKVISTEAVEQRETYSFEERSLPTTRTVITTKVKNNTVIRTTVHTVRTVEFNPVDVPLSNFGPVILPAVPAKNVEVKINENTIPEVKEEKSLEVDESIAKLLERVEEQRKKQLEEKSLEVFDYKAFLKLPEISSELQTSIISDLVEKGYDPIPFMMASDTFKKIKKVSGDDDITVANYMLVRGIIK